MIRSWTDSMACWTRSSAQAQSFCIVRY